MPTLKTIDLKVLDGTLEISDPINAGEEVVITVDFTGCGVDTWAKWLDVRLYNGTGAPISLGTDVVCTYTLPREMMLRGRIEFQPHAILGEETVKYDVKALTVNRSLQVVEDTVNYDPTVLGTLETAISDIQVELDTLDATKSPVGHIHDDRYYTETETNALLVGKSDTSHTHDSRYYTETETNTLLSGKSDTSHLHDDRYYTETETDTLLTGKSDVGHTHDDRYFTETEITTLLGGKSDTSHTHDERYYTETETDTLLSGKSNTSHTHDDRYFTETEVGVLLSGKSDTTHNHDLTYAPLVHNHDDIYYTDDEVDTLLLSKSDTTHTHDLIKNATEANAKIEASSTGAVITRNVNDANAPLVINNQQGTSKIVEFRFANATKASVDKFGNVAGYDISASNDLTSPNGLRNSTSVNNSYVNVATTGTLISRNIADANPALKVNQANASSTGKILDLQFNGTSKVMVDGDGTVRLPYASNIASTNNGYLWLPNAGPVIARNVADAFSALTVNQVHASSTGKIIDAQFGGASKFSVDKNGEVTASLSFATAYGLKNVNGATHSYVNVDTTGTKIERNIADANPALKVNQANASSTGNIAEFQFGGTTKLAIDKNGLIPQEAWIQPTLVNGWATDALTDANGFGYYKDSLGIVHFLGSMRSGTSTANTTLFTLPVGYRPARTVRRVPIREAGGYSTITINTDGTVVLGDAIVNNVWIALTNIHFRAEQ